MASAPKKTYPLFMATNRKVTKTGLSNDRSELLSYFECKTSDPPTKFGSWSKLGEKEFIDKLRAIGKEFPLTNAQERAFAGADVLADEDHTEQQQHLSLFVHGYNNSWEDSVVRYVQIKKDLFDENLGALVLYSWPSNGTAAGYYPDREDARKSGEQTAQLFTALHGTVFENEMKAAESKDPSLRCRAKISIIAHSMGNYVTQTGLAVAARRLNSPQLLTLIHQLVMVAADVDNDLFQRDQPDGSDGSLMANLCYRIGALYTGFDNVLGASASLKHFGKRRLGRSGLADSENVYDNVFAEDVSDLIVKKDIHSAVFKSPKAMKFLENILRGFDRNVLKKAA